MAMSALDAGINSAGRAMRQLLLGAYHVLIQATFENKPLRLTANKWRKYWRALQESNLWPQD
jgi:hypothetical protein